LLRPGNAQGLAGLAMTGEEGPILYFDVYQVL
jgi:hypothetical protein